jgi:hypothetical protein
LACSKLGTYADQQVGAPNRKPSSPKRSPNSRSKTTPSSRRPIKFFSFFLFERELGWPDPARNQNRKKVAWCSDGRFGMFLLSEWSTEAGSVVSFGRVGGGQALLPAECFGDVGDWTGSGWPGFGVALWPVEQINANILRQSHVEQGSSGGAQERGVFHALHGEMSFLSTRLAEVGE